MDFSTLRHRYEKSGPHDAGILNWILENIIQYVRRKRYPDSLAPDNIGSWDPDGYHSLLVGFLEGRKVKDRRTGLERTVYEYNLSYILDTCDNIKAANRLIQQQIHFYFQKRDTGITGNIVRRVKKIFRSDKRLYVFTGSEATPTYGLERWLASNPGPWDGDLSDLYQLVYSNLGDFTRKAYGNLSAYNSPEINDADLAQILCNMVVAANKRLTLTQIMYVLGYELGIREPEIESLEKETEGSPPLLESVAAEQVAPDDQIIYEETAERIYSELPEELKSLLPFIANSEDVKDIVEQSNRPQSTVYQQLNRIQQVLNKHIQNKFELQPVWRILSEKYLPKS